VKVTTFHKTLLGLMLVVSITSTESASILDAKIHAEFPFVSSFNGMGYVDYYHDVSSFSMLSAIGIGFLNSDKINDFVMDFSTNEAVKRSSIEMSVSELGNKWSDDERNISIGALIPLGDVYGLDINVERQSNAYHLSDSLQGELFKSLGGQTNLGVLFSYKDLKTTTNVFIDPQEVESKSFEYGLHFSKSSFDLGRFNLKLSKQKGKTEGSE